METPIFQAEKCPLTKTEKENLKYSKFKFPDEMFGRRGFQWFYPYNEDFLLIVEGELFQNQNFWDTNRTAIYYLIENGIWPSGKMVDKPLLEVLISSSGVPETPIEKMNEILHYISKNQKHFGEWFHLVRRNYDFLARKIGLINQDEFLGIIRESADNGLVKIKGDNSDSLVVVLSLRGWEIAERRNKEKMSDIAFVAMSFSGEMLEIFNSWIRPAIEECGFNALIILDDPIESDKTVNDAILAGIKKSRFTIADFTYHRAGVYFEAGYALGRGQKVIYTCQQDEMEDAHFDIRNYQHLVWKDGADLKRKLIDKIEVFIKA